MIILGGNPRKGGVGARNANYSYEKRAAPLDFEEGFGKLKKGLRKAYRRFKEGLRNAK